MKNYYAIIPENTDIQEIINAMVFKYEMPFLEIIKSQYIIKLIFEKSETRRVISIFLDCAMEDFGIDGMVLNPNNRKIKGVSPKDVVTFLAQTFGGYIADNTDAPPVPINLELFKLKTQ